MNLRRRFCSYLVLNLMKLPNLSKLSGGGATFDKTITRNKRGNPLARRGVFMRRIATPSILLLFFFSFWCKQLSTMEEEIS